MWVFLPNGSVTALHLLHGSHVCPVNLFAVKFELPVKLYKSSTFIIACCDIFFNEIIDYNIMNETPARLKKIELQ